MHRALLLALCLVSVSPGCAFLDRSGQVGSHARDYLTNTGALILEIDTAQGAGPNADALNVLVTTLQDVTGRTVCLLYTSDAADE